MVGAEPLGADGEHVGQVNVVGSIAWKRSGKESLAFRRDRFADPFFRLRADLNTAGIIFLLAGSLTFVAVRFTPIFNESLLLACAGSICAGLAAGPGLISVAWRRYLCMLCVAHRRLPVRLKPFLEWCYEVGLLRRSADAYEFRHEQLRMYLIHHAFDTLHNRAPGASSAADHSSSILVNPQTWFGLRPRSQSTRRNGWPA